MKSSVEFARDIINSLYDQIQAVQDEAFRARDIPAEQYRYHVGVVFGLRQAIESITEEAKKEQK